MYFANNDIDGDKFPVGQPVVFCIYNGEDARDFVTLHRENIGMDFTYLFLKYT